MRAVINWLFLTALSLWIGSIGFITLVLAPALRANFSEEQFYQTANVLLPIYFQLGLILGFVTLLISLVRTFRAERPKRLLKWVSALLFIMLSLTIFGSYGLLPQMQALESGAEQVRLYNYTQGISLLNLFFGLLSLLFISMDVRLLPGSPTRTRGYSLRF